jgi:polyferredoxin
MNSIIYFRKAIQILVFIIFAIIVIFPGYFIFGTLFFKASALTVARASFLGTGILLISTGVIIILLTFLFGRFFCGFICPLGTMSDFIDYITGCKKKALKLVGLKYHILLFLVLLTTGGLFVAWMFDPLILSAVITSVLVPNNINLVLVLSFCFFFYNYLGYTRQTWILSYLMPAGRSAWYCFRILFF